LAVAGNPLTHEEQCRLAIIQMKKMDNDKAVTQEDRESVAEFVAQKPAREEEQGRLEGDARRAEDE
jgi:hypothetical protein